MNLQFIIDRMIDLARDADPDGTYSILVGTMPFTTGPWIAERTRYRDCTIAQSRAIRNTHVLLVPAPGNIAHTSLVEYHGGILNGDITRHTQRRYEGPLISRR